MTVQMALEDGLTIARRNLIKIKRVPDLLVFTTLSPIMFVLLFAYVFRQCDLRPGHSRHREFLIAGIFTQTVIFGATWTWFGDGPKTFRKESSTDFDRCPWLRLPC